MDIDWNQDIYFPLSDYGQIGRAFNENSPESWTREQIIEDLVTGELEHVVAVKLANFAMGYARDVTEDIRDAVWQRWIAEGCRAPLPAFIDDEQTRADMALYDIRECA